MQSEVNILRNSFLISEWHRIYGIISINNHFKTIIMKIISRIMIVAGIMISNSLYAQDTSHTSLLDRYYPVQKTTNQPAPELNKATTQPVNNTTNSHSATTTTISQAPQINKTNNQEVPIPQTTSPQATSSQVQNTLAPTQTNIDGMGTDYYNPSGSSIYRDTRLGSSSPLYNTYKKNDDGAGAITTNPNKGW